MEPIPCDNFGGDSVTLLVWANTWVFKSRRLRTAARTQIHSLTYLLIQQVMCWSQARLLMEKSATTRTCHSEANCQSFKRLWKECSRSTDIFAHVERFRAKLQPKMTCHVGYAKVFSFRGFSQGISGSNYGSATDLQIQSTISGSAS